MRRVNKGQVPARRQARHFVAMAWPWGIQVGITRSRVSVKSGSLTRRWKRR